MASAILTTSLRRCAKPLSGVRLISVDDYVTLVYAKQALILVGLVWYEQARLVYTGQC